MLRTGFVKAFSIARDQRGAWLTREGVHASYGTEVRALRPGR
ncbi:hypothetical protein ACGFYZ_30940 [Streptomyces sp. NPDC048330]